MLNIRGAARVSFVVSFEKDTRVKLRIILSFSWVLGSFLLLSSVLYAVNDYQSRVLGAVTGQPGTPPTLERVKMLESNLRGAKNMDEARAIMDQIGQDMGKYLGVGSASIALKDIVQRVWFLWGVSATVPLVFLWWPLVSVRWRQFQTAAAGRTSPAVQGGQK